MCACAVLSTRRGGHKQKKFKRPWCSGHGTPVWAVQFVVLTWAWHCSANGKPQITSDYISWSVWILHTEMWLSRDFCVSPKSIILLENGWPFNNSKPFLSFRPLENEWIRFVGCGPGPLTSGLWFGWICRIPTVQDVSQPGVVAQICHSSTREAEARVQGQPAT